MADSRRMRVNICCLFLATLSGLLWIVAPGKRLKASGDQPIDLVPGSSAYETLISDSLFLYAPSVLDFDTQAFLETQPGPLAGYEEVIDGQSWTAADSIHYNAMRFGLNPQLILTLLEAQTQAVTGASIDVPLDNQASASAPADLTFHHYTSRLAQQSLLAYDSYRYDRSNAIINFPEGETLAVPEALNAGSYAVYKILAGSMSRPDWRSWVEGSRPRFVERFGLWFGDPRHDSQPMKATATLAPPGYSLPFPSGETWYYTGGPHYYGGGTPGCTYGWNCPRPWSSLDLAQPEMIACPGGSYPAHRWIVAAKGGDVIQSSQALVVIDHHDGWRTYYSHVSSADRRGVGPIDRGDRLGHPSCEVEPGGYTTGIHVHFALYQVGVGFVNVNGMEYSGWLVGETSHYNGTMSLGGALRQASTGRYAGTNDILNSGVNGACPISGGVVLYKHANYDCDGQETGAGYVIQSGSGFFDLPASFDNQASSIRIPPGWSAILYEFPGRAGASVCRSGDDATFVDDTFAGSAIQLNDRVSSLEVFENDDCSGPFVGGAWSVTYFSDTDLQTSCALPATVDGTYVFRDWGAAVPAENCPADGWSVRLSRHAYFPSGSYDLSLSADDWARIKVNGETVIDSWQGAGQIHASRTFSAGSYEVVVEYADLLAGAYLAAWWWGGGYPLPHEEQEADQWHARYWGNRDLGGEPVVFLNEGAGKLSHSWGDTGPGFSLPADRFSGRFERQPAFLCGDYLFQLSTDDGARFWIDDQLLLDVWFDQVGDYEVPVELVSGRHRLKVEHYENGGAAAVSLDWSHESFCPLPENAYLPAIRYGAKQ